MNKNLLFNIGVWAFILGAWSHAIYKEGLIKGGMPYLILIILVYGSVYGTQYFVSKVSGTIMWKAYKFFQIMFGVSFFLWLLTLNIDSINHTYFLYLVIMFFGASWITRNNLPQDARINLSLEEKIKSDLKIISSTQHKEFPKWLSFIGGFVMPALPMFLVLNKKWKKNLTEEALIHEHMHLYYLQRGGLFIFIIGMGLFLFIFKELLHAPDIMTTPIVFIYMVGMATYFEYITFKKTKEYGQTLNITTRAWDHKICAKYIKIYAIQLFAIYVVVSILQWLILYLWYSL